MNDTAEPKKVHVDAEAMAFGCQVVKTEKIVGIEGSGMAVNLVLGGSYPVLALTTFGPDVEAVTACLHPEAVLALVALIHGTAADLVLMADTDDTGAAN